MKITHIRLGHVSIPVRTPFRTAVRTVTHIEDVLIQIFTDQGAVGYGSAAPAPLITGDTEGGITAAIEGPLKQYLVGLAIENFEDALMQLHTLTGVNTGARAAVDIALYDLYGQLHGLPVYKLLGGHTSHLVTDITISLNAPEEMARDSLEALRRGFKTLKIKVRRSPNRHGAA